MSEIEMTALKQLANRLADEEGADILFINRPVGDDFDTVISDLVEKRGALRESVFVILVTEGGSADLAYSACRTLQLRYKRVISVVSGWCKSAGTLFCAGAHEIVFGRKGELGPVDAQMRRVDEIGERESGLAIDAAFDGLAEASFKLFEKYMMGIKNKSSGSVTFRTAADIAAQVAIGLVQPIFAQLDPMKVGEVHRSVKVAEQYARRLGIFGENLRRDLRFDAIDVLVRGYPSHRFRVDYLESHMLFRNVSEADGTLAAIIDSLGEDAITPISQDGVNVVGTTYRTEFLNDPIQDSADTSKAENGGSGGKRSQCDAKDGSAGDLSGSPSNLPDAPP